MNIRAGSLSEETNAFDAPIYRVNDRRPAEHSAERLAAFARVRFAPADQNIRTAVFETGIIGAGQPSADRQEGAVARVLSYRLFTGGYEAAAGLYAGLAEAVRRRSARLWLTLTNDFRDSEDRWSRQSVSEPLPGSLFDARYDGLTGHAAGLDAAICRQECLRQHYRRIPHGVRNAKPR